MFKITRFIISDLIRNWILLALTGFLLVATLGFFMLDAHADKALLGVMNTVLLVLPMAAVVFATIYYYNAYEFIGLLMAQPLKRHTILLSIFIGLSTVFCLAILFGIAIPLAFLNPGTAALTIVLVAMLLSVIFIAFALLGSLMARDKAQGMGLAMLVWAYFVLMFDGIVLLLMYYYSDYPIEKFVLAITFLNPVDLGRITALMQTEAAALMGASGAVFRDFFSSGTGTVLALLVMLFWAVVPMVLAVRKFSRKNI